MSDIINADNAVEWWEPVISRPSGRTGKVKRYRRNGKEYAGNIIWDDGGDLYSEMATRLASDPSALRALASDYDAALEHGDYGGVEA